MKKQEVKELVENYLEDDVVDETSVVTFITNQGNDYMATRLHENEIHFLEESLQINKRAVTILIDYSQIATIIIS